jgi:hypothetical protein
MDIPTPPEKNEPAKKKKQSSVTSHKSLEGERCLTRSATLTNLQVTSQTALEDEADDVLKDAFGAFKMVSASNKNNSTEVNLETLHRPVERDVMQSSNTMLPTICRESKIYLLLNLVQRARMGRPKIKSYKNGNFYSSMLFLTLCLLCFTQTASAMSF